MPPCTSPRAENVKWIHADAGTARFMPLCCAHQPDINCALQALHFTQNNGRGENKATPRYDSPWVPKAFSTSKIFRIPSNIFLGQCIFYTENRELDCLNQVFFDHRKHAARFISCKTPGTKPISTGALCVLGMEYTNNCSTQGACGKTLDSPY